MPCLQTLKPSSFEAKAVRAGLRETMIETHNQRGEPEQVLRKSVPVFQAGGVDLALFAYRLDRVEFHKVGWARLGFNAVYLREPSETVHDSTSTTLETGLVWEALKKEEYSDLLSSLKCFPADVQKASYVLRSHFQFHMRDCSFLFTEFIGMSQDPGQLGPTGSARVRSSFTTRPPRP